MSWISSVSHQRVFGRKPKAGEARRQGFHIVRTVTSTVEDYERILSNPDAIGLINKKLLEYGKLREVYELLSRDAFDLFKRADTELYQRLSLPLPNIVTFKDPQKLIKSQSGPVDN